MIKKPYQAITINECYEELLPIPLDLFLVENPPPYEVLGADYQGLSPYYLRKSVIESLIMAQNRLQQLKPRWQLKIFDAFRPIAIQQFMVDYTFDAICEEQNLNPNHLSETTKAEIYQQVFKIWAYPSDNPLTPPPHSTGAAIDLTLVDENDLVVDMGGDIDELSVRSQPNYYQNSSNKQAQQYHQNRQILLEAMTHGNFRRHPGEWWHFSLGDQMWAWLCNLDNPQQNLTAKYGRVGQT